MKRSSGLMDLVWASVAIAVVALVLKVTTAAAATTTVYGNLFAPSDILHLNIDHTMTALYLLTLSAVKFWCTRWMPEGVERFRLTRLYASILWLPQSSLGCYHILLVVTYFDHDLGEYWRWAKTFCWCVGGVAAFRVASITYAEYRAYKSTLPQE